MDRHAIVGKSTVTFFVLSPKCSTIEIVLTTGEARTLLASGRAFYDSEGRKLGAVAQGRRFAPSRADRVDGLWPGRRPPARERCGLRLPSGETASLEAIEAVLAPIRARSPASSATIKESQGDKSLLLDPDSLLDIGAQADA